MQKFLKQMSSLVGYNKNRNHHKKGTTNILSKIKSKYIILDINAYSFHYFVALYALFNTSKQFRKLIISNLKIAKEIFGLSTSVLKISREEDLIFEPLLKNRTVHMEIDYNNFDEMITFA